MLGAGEGDVERALGVDLVRGLLLALGGVDCVVCRAVEDDARLVVRERAVESRKVCHRDLLTREPDRVGQQLHQLRPQQTRRSEHDGFHVPGITAGRPLGPRLDDDSSSRLRP